MIINNESVFQSIQFANLPDSVLVDITREYKKAYKTAFDTTVGDSAIPSGPAFEHFPQERRTQIQRAMISLSLRNSRFLAFDEMHTRPQGGRFVKLRAGNIVLVEKFLTPNGLIPDPKYIRCLTDQPNFFEPNENPEDLIFAVIVHGYKAKPIFYDVPDFVDIIFPDPVNPRKASAALYRIDLFKVIEAVVPEISVPEIPKPTISLKILDGDIGGSSDKSESKSSDIE
jgi:hypothetical protein